MIVTPGTHDSIVVTKFTQRQQRNLTSMHTVISRLRLKISVIMNQDSGMYTLCLSSPSLLQPQNSSSFIAYEIDPNGHFKYWFMAIASSIEGWRYCSPNIAVDETFLRCKYGETLLTVATMDDSKNDASWKWFFEQLKLSFGDREGLVNPVSEVEFQVVDRGKNVLVKLNCNSCNCLFWDLEEIPRAHALIYCYATLLSTTYGGLVRPVGNHIDWSVVEVNDNILPIVFRL
uniref:Uncharacterized protein n=1 Tax=Cucumis melo TaxID=3656 RepID=A0A9I9EBH1_CUCME